MGALKEVLCAAYPSAQARLPKQAVGKVVHTARFPGARAPPEAPSLATQCTSVRFEKTYRASQRTNQKERASGALTKDRRKAYKKSLA